jgi:hypothetical protein
MSFGKLYGADGKTCVANVMYQLHEEPQEVEGQQSLGVFTVSQDLPAGDYQLELQNGQRVPCSTRLNKASSPVGTGSIWQYALIARD